MSGTFLYKLINTIKQTKLNPLEPCYLENKSKFCQILRVFHRGRGKILLFLKHFKGVQIINTGFLHGFGMQV